MEVTPMRKSSSLWLQRVSLFAAASGNLLSGSSYQQSNSNATTTAVEQSNSNDGGDVRQVVHGGSTSSVHYFNRFGLTSCSPCVVVAEMNKKSLSGASLSSSSLRRASLSSSSPRGPTTSEARTGWEIADSPLSNEIFLAVEELGKRFTAECKAFNSSNDDGSRNEAIMRFHETIKDFFGVVKELSKPVSSQDQGRSEGLVRLTEELQQKVTTAEETIKEIEAATDLRSGYRAFYRSLLQLPTEERDPALQLPPTEAQGPGETTAELLLQLQETARQTYALLAGAEGGRLLYDSLVSAFYADRCMLEIPFLKIVGRELTETKRKMGEWYLTHFLKTPTTTRASLSPSSP